MEDLDAVEETIAVLSDAAAMRVMADAAAELARGEEEDATSLAEAMCGRRDRGE